MTKPAIEVKNLSKSYIINHKDRASYSTIKDDFSRFVKKPFGGSKRGEEKFWALRDINFEIQPGEIYGVIGRNGSGKSTLLKILSRIVQPTHGEIIMRGKVASLLEVGTGFHPELTGRENIFFNGSMLGMSKNEIEKKFDEIVAFSEVEKFIDTPVKFYSSGMYVRLAFSVAAHLDPDILILDEVLAVGDVAFQDKSLKKIKSTMENGTTVLFVSHSMGAVERLCSKALMLNGGRVEIMGPTSIVTEKYTQLMRNEIDVTATIESEWLNTSDEVTNDYIKPLRLYVCDDTQKPINSSSPNNQDKWVVIEAEILKASNEFTIGYMIKNDSSQLLYMSFASDYKKGELSDIKPGKVRLLGKIPAHLLNEGSYKISLLGGIYNKFWLYSPDEPTPTVEISVSGGLSDSRLWQSPRSGLIAPNVEWRKE